MRRRRNIPTQATKNTRKNKVTAVLPISSGSKRKMIPIHADTVSNVKKRIPKRYEESDIVFRLQIP